MSDRIDEMNRLSDEIARMSGQWMQYVSQDHHKDRDCHFGVDMVWSYGEPAVFKAWHHGYIADYWSITCPSMVEAMRRLHGFLLRNLRSAYKHAVEVKGNEDDYWSTMDCDEAMELLREYAP